jgi:hypothetical protein
VLHPRDYLGEDMLLGSLSRIEGSADAIGPPALAAARANTRECKLLQRVRECGIALRTFAGLIVQEQQTEAELAARSFKYVGCLTADLDGGPIALDLLARFRLLNLLRNLFLASLVALGVRFQCQSLLPDLHRIFLLT